MFKSPTCTERDKRMAQRMARLANVSLEELGQEIFSSAQDSKSVTELLHSDYKEFRIAGHNLAVAQITSVDSASLLERKVEFLEEMRRVAAEHSFDMVLLMITDVLQDGTHLIYVGEDEIIQQAFSVTPRDNTAFLGRVMSRKKQVIPSLSALWG